MGFGTPTSDEGKYNTVGLFGDYTRDIRNSGIDDRELATWGLGARLSKD